MNYKRQGDKIMTEEKTNQIKETKDDNPYSFIKDHSLLEERSDVSNLFNFSPYILQLNSKLKTIKTPSIIGIIGKYGIGKSTMLYNLKKERLEGEKKDEHWFEFDAWRYPDKKDLWEGFVIDFNNDKKTTAIFKGLDYPTILASALLSLITVILPPMPEKILNSAITNTDKFIWLMLLFLPSLVIFYFCISYIKKSPPKRIDDLQKILKTKIEQINKDIFIVIEDVDRANDDRGIFFLETLSNFIKTQIKDNKKTQKNLIVLAPIAKENYKDNISTESLYDKSLDYIETFDITPTNIENFLEETIKRKYLENSKGNLLFHISQISSFFEQFFRTEEKMNTRILKKIFRGADTSYQHLCHTIMKTTKNKDNSLDVDFRICLCFETAKYFFFQDEKRPHPTETHYKHFVRHKFISPNNPYSAFLIAIAENKQYIYKHEKGTIYPNELIKTKTINLSNGFHLTPAQFPHEHPDMYYLSEIYATNV